jgi:hypothetical protein
LKQGNLVEPRSVYVLPAFFAAQYRFILADNLALAAGLIGFIFAVVLVEGCADLSRRNLAHRAF